jgi:pteridine reductase
MAGKIVGVINRQHGEYFTVKKSDTQVQNDSKVALVTGAARRVGAAIARALHARGCRVLLHYRHSQREADALAAELNQQRPHSAQCLSADFSLVQQMQPLMNSALAAFGRLDILVNSASAFYATPLTAATEQAWDDLMTTNVKSPYFLCQAALPALRAQSGHIINITDLHAEYTMRDYSIYCLSKASLAMLTRVLAKECGPAVRVNAVAPGVVAWPEGVNQLNEAEREHIINACALKTEGSPEAIAAAVLYLALDSAFVTGQTLHVDGGRML